MLPDPMNAITITQWVSGCSSFARLLALISPPAVPVEVMRIPSIGLWTFPVFVTTTFTTPSDSTTS